MYKKNCCYCKQDSYSAKSFGGWECPYCKKDISEVEPVISNADIQTHFSERRQNLIDDQSKKRS